jgi:hypothetical protein
MPEHEAGPRPGAGGGLRQKAVGLAEASDWKPGRAEVGAGPIQGAGWRAWAWARRRAEASPGGRAKAGCRLRAEADRAGGWAEAGSLKADRGRYCRQRYSGSFARRRLR